MGRVIGIDVGLHGAIAVLEGRNAVVTDMPVVERGGKKKVKMQVDGSELARILRPLCDTQDNRNPLCAYIEVVSTMPKQGIATNGSLMHSLGVVEGVLAALAIRTTKVSSLSWKAALGLLGKEKEASRRVAHKLHRKIELGKNKDGRADALLIAEYGAQREKVRTDNARDFMKLNPL